MSYDYAAVADRIESLTTTSDDVEAVMALLAQDDAAATGGIEECAAKHGPPSLDSMQCFERFVLDRYAHDVASLHDAGRSENGHYVGFEHRDFGNDYGNAPTLGAAMWSAYVRLVGEVHSDEDDDSVDDHGTKHHDPDDHPHLPELRAAARRLAKTSSWFTTPEGIEEMLDKSYVVGSVHRSLIVDVLHDGIETGEADPLRTLARALTVLAGETGGDRRLLAAAQAMEPFVEASDQDTIPSQ